MDIDEIKTPPPHEAVAVNPPIPEGWRYFLQSGTISLVGISLLAFSLTLCIWNTLRAFTYVTSPLPSMIGLRCVTNISICLWAVFMIAASKRWCPSWARGVRVLGNVLGGIGLWELIESLVSCATMHNPVIDLIIYGTALVACSIVVFCLYRFRGINIIESSLLSPV